jgi:protein-S-isoprenylcysteine O-methyltransferase Ste14
MKSLEAKIPPPAVAAAIALAMWGISLLLPLLQISSALRLGATAVIGLAGIGFSAAGVLEFRRARTTLNPTKPEEASTLVSSGVFRITRNPMYVGLLCVLVAWAVFLASVWALLGPVVFVLCIGHFQIAPEERVLKKLFGSEYTDYQARVRRWL